MAIIFVESIDREEGAILDAATFRPFFLVFKSSASMVPSFIFFLFCASVQDKAILDLMSQNPVVRAKEKIPYTICFMWTLIVWQLDEIEFYQSFEYAFVYFAVHLFLVA